MSATREPQPSPFVPCGCQYDPAFQWFCVRTQFHAEILALQRLRMLGLCTWLPEFLLKDHIRPLFPTYLFVQLDLTGGLWRLIYRQPGVMTILGTHHERPTAVPTAALETLWLECAPNGVIYPDEKPAAGPVLARFLDGAAVELAAGPFAGLSGVCRWSSSTRVAILLRTLGGKVMVSARRGDVIAGRK